MGIPSNCFPCAGFFGNKRGVSEPRSGEFPSAEKYKQESERVPTGTLPLPAAQMLNTKRND